MRGGGGGMGSGYHGIVPGDNDNSIRQIPDSALAIRMLKYLLRYKRRAAVMFVTVVLTTGLNLIPTLLYGTAIDKYIPNTDATGLTLVAIGYLLVVLATYASQFTQNYLIEWLFGRMEYDMREDIL